MIFVLTSFTSLNVFRYRVNENRERSFLLPMNSFTGMRFVMFGSKRPTELDTTMMLFMSL
jgi:hypothetical protein